MQLGIWHWHIICHVTHCKAVLHCITVLSSYSVLWRLVQLNVHVTNRFNHTCFVHTVVLLDTVVDDDVQVNPRLRTVQTHQLVHL